MSDADAHDGSSESGESEIMSIEDWSDERQMQVSESFRQLYFDMEHWCDNGRSLRSVIAENLPVLDMVALSASKLAGMLEVDTEHIDRFKTQVRLCHLVNDDVANMDEEQFRRLVHAPRENLTSLTVMLDMMWTFKQARMNR